MKKDHQIVRAVDVAAFMSFSKASVSVALKKLKQYGQEHILERYQTLDDHQKAKMIKQIKNCQNFYYRYIDVGVNFC